MKALALAVLVIVVLGAGVTGYLNRLHSRLRDLPNAGEIPSVAWDTERIAIYVLSLAGLVAMLYGVSGLLATIVVALIEHSHTLVSTADVRDRTSYYLASLVVGLPTWAGLWTLAQRRSARSRKERHARERRFYLATIFGISSVVALFALHTVLRVFLTRLGILATPPPTRNGIFAGGRMVVWTLTWLIFARVGWLERSSRANDETHDLAVYALTGFALAFMVIGLYEAIGKLLTPLVSHYPFVEPVPMFDWATWGGILAWALSGVMLWSPIWQYDLRRGGARYLRIRYLYIALAVAVLATLGELVYGIYELLTWSFGDHRPNQWAVLRDIVPILLIGSGGWIYHWMVLRNQHLFHAEEGAFILWPRREGIALLAITGLAAMTISWTSLFWLGLDGLLHTSTALSGPYWWRDRVSLCLAGGTVGGITWLIAWSILQRAAREAPRAERTATERRKLLGLATVSAALVAIGFTVSLLWTLFRALLGGSIDASTSDRALKDLCTVLIALLVAGYHGLILREDRRLSPAVTKKIRVMVLAAPGAEEMLIALRQIHGRTIELVGRLGPEAVHDPANLSRLEDQLIALESGGRADGAVLILRNDAISLHPYIKASVSEVTTLAQPEPLLPNIPIDTKTEIRKATPS